MDEREGRKEGGERDSPASYLVIVRRGKRANPSLIALLSCNRELASGGLQLRIINEVVSLHCRGPQQGTGWQAPDRSLALG